MGQAEVLEFLEEKRKETNDWFTATDIKAGLEEKGLSNGAIRGVYNNLYQLMRFGTIQYKGVGVWNHKKMFRAKKD